MTIPSINNANFAEMVRGLSEELATNEMQVLLGYTNYNAGEEERLIRQLLQRRPEALVLTGGHHTDRARRLLSHAGIPVIETWDLPADPVEHVVGFSNPDTARMTLEHLVSLGFERIAYIGGDTAGDTRGADRRCGFVETMMRLGKDPSRLVSAGSKAPISMREGADAMADLLQRHPDTQAVICVSDLSAFGAVTECQRRGISVPGDIAVAGFGNFEISSISVPTITTVDPFPFEIGRQCAALIMSIRRGTLERRGPELVALEPELLPRESTCGSIGRC